jgi:hypothetical protein
MAIAFVGAYILGRLKKFKLAIAWFGLMTGYKLTLSPDELLAHGAKLVESSPQLQRLVTALGGPLLEAAKQAAVSVATDQLGGLADQLADRVENLGRAAGTATAGTAASTATNTGERGASSGAPRSGGQARPPDADDQQEDEDPHDGEDGDGEPGEFRHRAAELGQRPRRRSTPTDARRTQSSASGRRTGSSRGRGRR